VTRHTKAFRNSHHGPSSPSRRSLCPTHPDIPSTRTLLSRPCVRIVFLEMESRKRLGSDTSVASSSRPAKRIATDTDQIPIQTDPFSYDDLSFINDFRREAIYRTLVAERRETSRLKERLKQSDSQSVFHGDHIRLIDLWLKQLLEELAVSYGQYDSSTNGTYIY
jgi:hypothetical protein